MRNLLLALGGVLALAAVAAAPAGAETHTFHAMGTPTPKGNDPQGRPILSRPLSFPGLGKGTAPVPPPPRRATPPRGRVAPPGPPPPPASERHPARSLAAPTPEVAVAAPFPANLSSAPPGGRGGGTPPADPAGGSVLAGTGKITGG